MGREIITPQGMTPNERSFVAAFLKCGDPVHAVNMSKYGGNPDVIAWELMRSPKIVAAIQSEISLRIRTEGATIAHNVLMDVAKDTTAPKGVRVDAAKALLDRAGFIAPRAEAPKQQDGRPLSDYSIDELRGLVSQLERTRGDTARDVTRAVSPPIADNLSEMMD